MRDSRDPFDEEDQPAAPTKADMRGYRGEISEQDELRDIAYRAGYHGSDVHIKDDELRSYYDFGAQRRREHDKHNRRADRINAVLRIFR